MGEPSSSFDFVAIGLDGTSKLHLNRVVDGKRVKFVDDFASFEAFVDGFELDENGTILAGGAIPQLSATELGQSLRGSYLSAHIIFVATDVKDFSVSELKKNGYSKALMLPMDRVLFEEFLISSARGGIRKRYKAVEMVDIEPGEKLDFSVYYYMPMNQKYALLTANGTISPEKYQVLKEKSETTVFVRMDQVESFYSYSAEKLAKLSDGSSRNGSETERKERLKHSIQALFHNILDYKVDADYEYGRDLMEQSHKIIEKFVELKAKIDLREQIQGILNLSDDAYSHAQTVSSLACLLSLSLEIGAPEELAIAGLFHDIGLNGFPEEPNPLALDYLTEEGMSRYATHPISSINLLKRKRFVLTPSVSEIIEKHHERIDGKGFPGALPAHKIPLTAQLLAFCDCFGYLMRPQPGCPRPDPVQITEQIQLKAGLALELTMKIKKIFLDLVDENKRPLKEAL